MLVTIGYISSSKAAAGKPPERTDLNRAQVIVTDIHLAEEECVQVVISSAKFAKIEDELLWSVSLPD